MAAFRVMFTPANIFSFLFLAQMHGECRYFLRESHYSGSSGSVSCIFNVGPTCNMLCYEYVCLLHVKKLIRIVLRGERWNNNESSHVNKGSEKMTSLELAQLQKCRSHCVCWKNLCIVASSSSISLPAYMFPNHLLIHHTMVSFRCFNKSPIY